MTADLTLGESVNNLGPVGLEVSPLPVPVYLKWVRIMSLLMMEPLPQKGR